MNTEDIQREFKLLHTRIGAIEERCGCRVKRKGEIEDRIRRLERVFIKEWKHNHIEKKAPEPFSPEDYSDEADPQSDGEPCSHELTSLDTYPPALKCNKCGVCISCKDIQVKLTPKDDPIIAVYEKWKDRTVSTFGSQEEFMRDVWKVMAEYVLSHSKGFEEQETPKDEYIRIKRDVAKRYLWDSSGRLYSREVALFYAIKAELAKEK